MRVSFIRTIPLVWGSHPILPCPSFFASPCHAPAGPSRVHPGSRGLQPPLLPWHCLNCEKKPALARGLVDCGPCRPLLRITASGESHPALKQIYGNYYMPIPKPCQPQINKFDPPPGVGRSVSAMGRGQSGGDHILTGTVLASVSNSVSNNLLWLNGQKWAPNHNHMPDLLRLNAQK